MLFMTSYGSDYSLHTSTCHTPWTSGSVSKRETTTHGPRVMTVELAGPSIFMPWNLAGRNGKNGDDAAGGHYHNLRTVTLYLNPAPLKI